MGKGGHFVSETRSGQADLSLKVPQNSPGNKKSDATSLNEPNCRMDTVAIELEPDAYEKLEDSKTTKDESWSEVIRRGVFPKPASTPPMTMTGREILEYMENLREEHPQCFLSNEALDELEWIQEKPHVSPSPWDELKKPIRR